MTGLQLAILLMIAFFSLLKAVRYRRVSAARSSVWWTLSIAASVLLIIVKTNS